MQYFKWNNVYRSLKELCVEVLPALKNKCDFWFLLQQCYKYTLGKRQGEVLDHYQVIQWVFAINFVKVSTEFWAVLKASGL